MTNKMDTKQLKTAITKIASANNAQMMQDVFVNMIYSGLIHNNILVDSMMKIRNSEANGKFKAGLNKFMPCKYNKDLDAYEYSKDKANKLLADLGLEFRTSSIDDVANALPNLFEKKEKEAKEFNLAEYLANVGKKLAKEDVQNHKMITEILTAIASDQTLLNGAAYGINTIIQDRLNMQDETKTA